MSTSLLYHAWGIKGYRYVRSHYQAGRERFEKLYPFPILGLRKNFLKDVKQSAAAEQAFTGSGTSGEVLDGSGFVSEPPHSPGRRVYMVALEMIFIPLATLKAACRNQASNWFSMMVVNLARLARPWRWLMPKYCFYPVAASANK